MFYMEDIAEIVFLIIVAEVCFVLCGVALSKNIKKPEKI